MTFKTLMLGATLVSLNVFATDYVKGTLAKTENGFAIQNTNGLTAIITSDKIAESLPSLESPSYVTQSNGKKYAYEFKGETKSDGFHLEEVPTNIAGEVAITGTLTYNLADNHYYIDGKQAKFGYTKELNGYSFDDVSKTSFIFKKVLAEGHMEGDVFVINAITPTNLLEATEPNPAPGFIQHKLDQLGAWDFILYEMNKNEISQSEVPFRLKLHEDEENKVAPGDSFIVFTLGGRQGDSFGSVNGHFVSGIGEVREDMTLRGEVSNAYVTNGKDILSGNTSLTNYFSHLVQGQNNYRPTYTLIAYGIDQEKLKGFRDYLEESHIQFRTQKLDITPEFNCTTETVKALASVGIQGNYKKLDNWLKGIVTSPLYLFGSTPRTLHYSLRNDSSKFQPRPAYNSFAGVLLRDDLRERLGAKRVDFVFYPQIKSNRPVGGTALNTLFDSLHYKKLYDRYEVEEELSPEELRPLLLELNNIQ